MREFPIRVKCAALVWRTVEDALSKNKSGEMEDYNNAKMGLDLALKESTLTNEKRFKELSKNFTQKRKDIFNGVSGARDRNIVPDNPQLDMPEGLTKRIPDWFSTPNKLEQEIIEENSKKASKIKSEITQLSETKNRMDNFFNRAIRTDKSFNEQQKDLDEKIKKLKKQLKNLS